ncbi:MAG TPA: AraC family transcriptional regulator [Chthonomonadaceae bacterium]|nr:AraC family transcriptional regulator [Chthonomonadaceae bacterium]
MHRMLPSGTYYGHNYRQRQVGDFLFSESRYEASRAIPPHAHESAFFYLVLDGACLDTVNGGERQAARSSLMFHPAGDTHANIWSPSGGACFHIEILPAKWVHLQERGTTLRDRLYCDGGMAAWIADQAFRNFQQTDAASVLALEGLTLELIAEIVRAQMGSTDSTPPRWLRRTHDLLRERFDENLSLEEISRVVDVHPSHLARAFRQHYHCTIGDFVRQLRIEFACRELLGSDRPLIEIALEAGFADQSHFARVFRRYTGRSPTEYAKHFGKCNTRTRRC